MKGDTLMAHAYEKNKDADGFLYITYTEESTLGAIWRAFNIKVIKSLFKNTK